MGHQQKMGMGHGGGVKFSFSPCPPTTANGAINPNPDPKTPQPLLPFCFAAKSHVVEMWGAWTQIQLNSEKCYPEQLRSTEERHPDLSWQTKASSLFGPQTSNEVPTGAPQRPQQSPSDPAQRDTSACSRPQQQFVMAAYSAVYKVSDISLAPCPPARDWGFYFSVILIALN